MKMKLDRFLRDIMARPNLLLGLLAVGLLAAVALGLLDKYVIQPTP